MTEEIPRAKRGRRSKAELSIVGGVTVPKVESISRPKPPAVLDAPESRVWSDVVGALPADWFDEATYPLLIQYCRHTVHAHQLAAMAKQIAAGDDFQLDQYTALLAEQRKETAAMVSLATKMRIAQQSTTNHRGNKTTAPVAARPWEIE